MRRMKISWDNKRSAPIAVEALAKHKSEITESFCYPFYTFIHLAHMYRNTACRQYWPIPLNKGRDTWQRHICIHYIYTACANTFVHACMLSCFFPFLSNRSTNTCHSVIKGFLLLVYGFLLSLLDLSLLGSNCRRDIQKKSVHEILTIS